MATALISTPDPNNPGGVILTELHNLSNAFVEGGGVLAVKVDEESALVYYGPGAWHSFTRGDGPLLPD